MAFGRLVLGAALLAVVPTAMAAEAGAEAEGGEHLNPAQVALFRTDHLKDVTRPVALEYAFQHRGGKSGDFSDKVTEEIRTIHEDGKKDVWIDFLGGDRRVEFPPVMDFAGNPLLMYVLEYDVREMHEATGGTQLYFRNRVRNAFLDAEMHPVAFERDGRTEQGTEIVIAPFRNDPNIARFPAFAEKTYHFVLSPAVPGGIYRIGTSVPRLAGGSSAFEDEMTYAGERPLGG